MEKVQAMIKLRMQFIWENGGKEKDMGKEFWKYHKNNIIKDYLIKILNQGLVESYLIMEIFMKENIEMEVLMGKENIFGQMALYILDNS